MFLIYSWEEIIVLNKFFFSMLKTKKHKMPRANYKLFINKGNILLSVLLPSRL